MSELVESILTVKGKRRIPFPINSVCVFIIGKVSTRGRLLNPFRFSIIDLCVVLTYALPLKRGSCL